MEIYKLVDENNQDVSTFLRETNSDTKTDNDRNELFNIIKEFLSQSVTDQQIEKLNEKAINIPEENIPNNLPEQMILQVLEKYKSTENENVESCSILILECISAKTNYDAIFKKTDFFNNTFEKISTSTFPSNIILMVKILSNIYNSHGNKEEALKSICSLNSKFLEINNVDLYDYLFKFFYIYTSPETETDENKKKIIADEILIIIFDTLLNILENCQKTSLVLSPFSIELIFLTLANIIPQSPIDFSTIINHPIINNKYLYLFNSSEKVTTAYIKLLTNLMFYRKINPFGIDIFDILALVKHQNKLLVNSAILLLKIMISSSTQILNELTKIDLSIFESIYQDLNFDGKCIIAYLYHDMIGNFGIENYFDFFVKNNKLLFQFFELDDDEITILNLFFIHDTCEFLFDEGSDENINIFSTVLNDNNFQDKLNDFFNQNSDPYLEKVVNNIHSFFYNDEEE